MPHLPHPRSDLPQKVCIGNIKCQMNLISIREERRLGLHSVGDVHSKVGKVNIRVVLGTQILEEPMREEIQWCAS